MFALGECELGCVNARLATDVHVFVPFSGGSRWATSWEQIRYSKRIWHFALKPSKFCSSTFILSFRFDIFRFPDTLIGRLMCLCPTRTIPARLKKQPYINMTFLRFWDIGTTRFQIDELCLLYAFYCILFCTIHNSVTLLQGLCNIMSCNRTIILRSAANSNHFEVCRLWFLSQIVSSLLQIMIIIYS